MRGISIESSIVFVDKPVLSYKNCMPVKQTSKITFEYHQDEHDNRLLKDVTNTPVLYSTSFQNNACSSTYLMQQNKGSLSAKLSCNASSVIDSFVAAYCSQNCEQKKPFLFQTLSKLYLDLKRG